MRRLVLPPLALLLAILPLAACETSIMIDPPPFEEALVVYAFPTPDSSWNVAVGRTRPLGVYRSFEVLDATVVIKEGGVPLDTLRIVPSEIDGFPPQSNAPSQYVSSTGATPEAGRTYRIEVSAPGFPPASAETTLPLAPEAEVLSDEWTYYDDVGYNSRKLRVTLTDPPGDDIYELALLMQERYDESLVVEYAVPFTSVFPSLREGYDLLDVDVDVETDTEYYSGTVFRDALFAGQRKTFDLRFDTLPDDLVTRSYALTLARVTEPFARYQISRSQQNNNEENPFAEPTPLYSNVEGGHGVVGAFTSVRIQLPDPPPPALAAR